MGGSCIANGGEEERVLIICGKARRKEPLGRPRRRWVDNIRMDLGEVGWGMWTGFIWLRIGTGGELL
jgi:hypothetical protein